MQQDNAYRALSTTPAHSNPRKLVVVTVMVIVEVVVITG